jgi:hypothetical protein
MGRPSAPSGALTTGFWYMLGSRIVWLMVGLLCRREHLSPWRQHLRAGEVAECHRGAHDRGHTRPGGRQDGRGTCAGDRPDLEVEGAVHAVLLGTEDGRKMLSHGGWP